MRFGPITFAGTVVATSSFALDVMQEGSWRITNEKDPMNVQAPAYAIAPFLSGSDHGEPAQCEAGMLVWVRSLALRGQRRADRAVLLPLPDLSGSLLAALR